MITCTLTCRFQNFLITAVLFICHPVIGWPKKSHYVLVSEWFVVSYPMKSGCSPFYENSSSFCITCGSDLELIYQKSIKHCLQFFLLLLPRLPTKTYPLPTVNSWSFFRIWLGTREDKKLMRVLNMKPLPNTTNQPISLKSFYSFLK